MGKTIRAMLEELFKSRQVSLTQEEIDGLLTGWLDDWGPKDFFDWLIVEIGRACRVALDAGRPANNTTLREVLCRLYIQ